VYLAGVVIGKPRHEGKYSGTGECVEIRRMACVDDLPKNSESWLLAKTIWWLKNHTHVVRVISYSDQSVGHTGTIYKAANFKLIGETSLSKHVFWKGKRYHPRSLTIERPYSYEMRKGIETGDTTIETGEPKLIFEYMIKRKTTLPVSKLAETFRAESGFAGGSPRPDENLPRDTENRQGNLFKGRP